MYKNLIRNLTPPPKDRNIKDYEEEDNKNSINTKILNENTNNNK